MTTLVACLSTGKGTWGAVIKLVKSGEFEKVYLVTNSFGKDKFDAPENTEMIVLDTFQPEEGLRDRLKEEFKILKGDVAVNLTSGSGREHMAILSALLHMGVGIRLVIPGEDGFVEL